ncbi:MAG: TIR domain-containing protein [Acidobacteria bacterium]|nr:MAG: TIR domain-containing protein [Acidobacteriota bacterium]
MDRRLVFVSHANPEDNQFAQWLVLQLARQGYLVWSDFTKLVGGELIWPTVEQAIRCHTAIFLFVLSGASNSKQGTLAELRLASTIESTENLKGFVVPLSAAHISYSDMNILIHGRYAIEFTASWAEGLTPLLERLE